ncbi:MAG: hypothetical protein Q9212_003717 [Teloschistes hypoglaucus]
MAFRLPHRVLDTQLPTPRPTSHLRRAIHLLHCIYSARDGSDGRLASLAWRKLADPSRTELQFRKKGSRVIDAVTLSQAIARLHPGSYLERLQPLDNVDSIPERSYEVSRLRALHPKPVLNSGPAKVINFKRAGRGKEIHLTSALSTIAYAAFLTKTYNHLINGARLEMHLRLTKRELSDHKDLDHVLSEHPHLRPEAILKGMPEGTVILYEPLYEEKLKQLIWVMANEENWTGVTATGWKGSAMAPPSKSAMKMLKGLPIIQAPAQSDPAHLGSHTESLDLM